MTALTALLAPAAASAAPRMWVGFQDDPSFRWVDDRSELLDEAQRANSTVIRTTVYWSKLAPRRPANAANPFDPAYIFDDLDEFVRGAQQRGIEVMLTIWGTPRWAGPAENRLPRRLADFQNFSRALAARYSGRFPGYPHVKFFTIWNEPNRGIFLAPQFDARGRPVAHVNYAKLARAGWAGIKAGNRNALVAIGATASHGRDVKTARQDRQDTHSPGRFAQLLSQLRPRVRFDAWAHHPYPTTPAMRPNQKVKWPNVSLANMPTFGQQLDRWYARKDIALWITEYGHETRPPNARGITPALQRTYLQQAFTIARNNPRVQMFIWFILADRASVPWKSGLIAQNGSLKPAFNTFATLARNADARQVTYQACGASPLVGFSALEMASRAQPGAPVGITFEVRNGSLPVAADQPQSQLGFDGWVWFRPAFTAQRGGTYTLRLTANAESGLVLERTLRIVCPRR